MEARLDRMVSFRSKLTSDSVFCWNILCNYITASSNLNISRYLSSYQLNFQSLKVESLLRVSLTITEELIVCLRHLTKFWSDWLFRELIRTTYMPMHFCGYLTQNATWFWSTFSIFFCSELLQGQNWLRSEKLIYIV